MKKIFTGIIFALVFVSCYHSAPETAFNMSMVLPADSMVNLLTDLHLADGIMNVTKDKKLTSKSLSTAYFESILKKHQITETRFEESMRYYAFHVEELDKIYEKVIINLSKMESMSKQENKEKEALTD